MPLTEFQQEYLRSCSHRWNVKTGATRSGKTYLDCAVTIPKRICAARGEGLLVMLGNTLGTLERNVLEPMRGLWGPELVGVVRTSASGNIVQLFGRKIYVLGADNKKHIARIQGAAFEYAYGDEITTWDEGVFQMLKSRLSCPHSHFDGTCNPESPSHWFKKFLDSDADIYCQAYTIDDNPTLPAQFVADLKKEYTGTVYYNRFILGQWMAANGVIYRLLAVQTEASQTDVKSWVVCADHVREHSGALNASTTDNPYIRTGPVTTKGSVQRTLSIQGDRYVGDAFQDFLLSHKIAFGSGQSVVVPYVYFSLRTGKGEKGEGALILTSDVGGSAGANATFAADFKGIGTPAEFDYNTAVAG